MGRTLYDALGHEVVLRGINLPLLDDWNFPGSDGLSELVKSKANAVTQPSSTPFFSLPTVPSSCRTAFSVLRLSNQRLELFFLDAASGLPHA
jgi:hypothetical protein